MKPIIKTIAISVALFFCVVVMQRQRLDPRENQSSQIHDLNRQEEIISTNLALGQQLPSLGFDNFIANWFFLQFLQYFGDTPAREVNGYSLSPEFFKIIIPNDPYFRLFYIFMSGSTSNFAGQPEVSIELLSEGLQHMTPTVPDDSFYLWRYKAVDQLLFLGDGEAAQQSFQTAADWARQSSHADAPFIAENSQRTADFLANNPDSRFAQINSWFTVLANAFDDATRQRAIERIEALGGQVVPNERGGFSIQLPTED